MRVRRKVKTFAERMEELGKLLKKRDKLDKKHPEWKEPTVEEFDETGEADG